MNNDFITDFDVFYSIADFFYNTNALMTENATIGNFRVFTLPIPKSVPQIVVFNDFKRLIGRIDNLRARFFFETDVVCAMINHCFHVNLLEQLINSNNTA